MMSRIRVSASAAYVLFCALVLGASVANAAPSISLGHPASTVQETMEESVALSGSATTNNRIANIYWVSQTGQRGAATWTENAQGLVAWRVENVPLHTGVNLLTVIAVDATNRSQSVRVAVNRKPVAGAPSLKVGVGSFHNRPVEYQIWQGHAVMEGDILFDLSAFTTPERTGQSTGPRAVSPEGSAIDYASQFWPQVNGVYVVPYIVTGSSTILNNAITAFNQAFSGLIQFMPRASQTNYVNIIVDGGGSSEGYSNVGMVGNEQTLECGSGCTIATWLHEMGHTVGLLHEHQRPDRASYISLNLANADLPNIPGNFTLFSYDYQTVGLYDYASVMHYCAFCFSKAGLPVIDSIPAGMPLSNDVGYSAGDLDQIERLYGAAPSEVTITTNPTGLQIVVDGTTYTAPHSFAFALNSNHTVALPTDPQYPSTADGSDYAFGNWNDLGARSHTITIQPGTGTLTSPANEPAVTVYEASFVHLLPFAFSSPAAYPSGSGTVTVSPTPTPEFGGAFFADRSLVSLTYSTNAGYNFYGWDYLPYPQSDNPHKFYIQSPTSSAQAVFEPNSKPVTILGESITGPNSTNPLLVANVDNAPALLPAGFTADYNSGWTGSSSHSVAVNQTQSPVTTNVYYNWNSWSDGLAMTHSIVQPTTGSQTVSASFTPFYASYTVPPALGSNGSSCAGGVTTSPAGVSYPVNTAFGFYQDGTSVTSTATPNPSFPAMVFAGWTGSLSGATNPLTVTVDDQFVPTANFNLTSTPLTITSLSPASAVVSTSSAPIITVNGTGFLSGSTYAYWNGSYRSITVNNSTQLTMHLTAGDLAATGGQDVYVGNYTTNSSQVTCGVGAETSFTVALTAPGSAGSTATYTGSDTTTEGTWTPSYGMDGYTIANDVSQQPSYASVSVTGASTTTWAASTTDVRALQATSGASNRIASGYTAANTVTFNVNVTDGNAHRVALYLLDWTKLNRVESVSILDAGNDAVLSTQTFSNLSNGVYGIWNISGHVLIQVKLTSGGPNTVVSGIFFGSGATAAASYAGQDSSTEGLWTGSYGADGYLIANDATQTPAYATVSFSGDSTSTQAASTSDPRALQTASGVSSRIASAYYASSTFTVNVNLTDGNTHRVALYLLDWAKLSRAESVTIVDANSNAVLSTQAFSAFSNGVYGIWNIKGHVLIQVKLTGGGPNAVASGVFFDPVSTSAATYISTDTATEGTWTGTYGSNGFAIANETAQLPSYATLSFSGASTSTQAASTSDPRALQTASGASTRIASAYYAASTVTLNLNLTDGNAHRVALYLLDWAKLSRVETVSILDATTNAVLSTQSFSAFSTGVYGVWNLRGHVLIEVKLTSGGPNAVISGVFLDPAS